MKNFFTFVFSYIKKTQEQTVGFLCTQVSYRLLVAIFPFLFIVIILLSKISADTILQSMDTQDALSETFINIFIGYMNAISVGEENMNVTQFSIFSAIYVFAIYYMLKCLIPLNNAFNIIMNTTENRSFIRVYTSSLIATLGMLFGIAAVIIIFTIDIVSNIPILNQIAALDIFFEIISSITFLIPTIVYAFVLTIIYLILPAKKYSFKFTIVNIVLSTFIWSIGTWIFSMYLNYTANNFHVVFGSLGTVISLFIWLNFFSQSILYTFSFTQHLFQYFNIDLKMHNNRILSIIDKFIDALISKIEL